MSTDKTYVFYKPTVQDWLSVLTKAGWDVVETNASTSRTRHDAEQWNGNFPIQSLTFHLKHCDEKAKQGDIVLSAYTTNANREYTVYGTLHNFPSKRKKYQAKVHAGYVVPNGNETELSSENFEALKASFHDQFGWKYSR